MRVEIDSTGRYRDATKSEERGMRTHLKEYPECDGSLIMDDNDQTLGAYPYLVCKGCGNGKERVFPE